MKIGFLLSLLLLLGPLLCTAEITSLQPGSASPGTQVILTTRPTDLVVGLNFGQITVSPLKLADGVFQFQVPDLPPGDYSVEVQGGADTPNSAPFWFQILPRAPVLAAITPDTFSFCRAAGPEELELTGTGFADTATVLLDGSSIAVASRSPGRINLQLPPLPAGLHKLQVVNPDGQGSLPAAISVVQQPLIHQVVTGNSDAITSYQLTIQGENFTPDSQLVLNGTPLPSRSSDLQTGDRVSYIDCTTLVYQRHPMAGQPQELEFRVVNPDGQVSNSYTVNGY